ncbi:MAG: RsmB/NOP family class I SAM-dependent RNA methyltransferase [Mycetocola sp.]
MTSGQNSSAKGKHAAGPRSGRPRRGPGPDNAPARLASPARRVAYRVLHAVSADDAYANLLLPVEIDRNKLSRADAALATELCYGTLRLRGFYDAVIELAAQRGLDRIDPEVQDILRLGAHQILNTRIPDHAAVDESVLLTRERGRGSASGFVNGVLRTISRTSRESWTERIVDGATGVDDALGRSYAHPSWIVRAFRQSLRAEGREDELEQLLAADNSAPVVNLIALPGLAARPDEAEANIFSPDGFRSTGGDPDQLVKSSNGMLRVQDEGSQLVALALAAAPVDPSIVSERWLDLCSGPGGKTALLAAKALSSGAQLDAVEMVPARAGLVRRAVAPVPLDVTVDVADGTQIGQYRPASYSRILVDAPCTGLGALRRRPEARWRKGPSDVADLGRTQLALIHSAFAALEPGGVLAYVTCSPHIAETRGIVSTALKKWGDEAELLNAPAILSDVTVSELPLGEPLSDGEGATVQLWPHRHGTDAMFLALVRKRR